MNFNNPFISKVANYFSSKTNKDFVQLKFDEKKHILTFLSDDNSISIKGFPDISEYKTSEQGEFLCHLLEHECTPGINAINLKQRGSFVFTFNGQRFKVSSCTLYGMLK